jgi:predicted DCC family thiol-disulfide oxidoreductase YuxK
VAGADEREHAGLPVGESWTVVYDGDCGFCKWLLASLLRWDRAERLRPVALQSKDATELLGDLDTAERMASWHLVSPDGKRLSGGAAIAPLLRLLPGGAVAAAPFALLPGLTDRGYRWVAAHRSQLSRPVPKAWKKRADVRMLARSGK